MTDFDPLPIAEPGDGIREGECGRSGPTAGKLALGALVALAVTALALWATGTLPGAAADRPGATAAVPALDAVEPSQAALESAAAEVLGASLASPAAGPAEFALVGAYGDAGGTLLLDAAHGVHGCIDDAPAPTHWRRVLVPGYRAGAVELSDGAGSTRIVRVVGAQGDGLQWARGRVLPRKGEPR